jgi:hypothetical protein
MRADMIKQYSPDSNSPGNKADLWGGTRVWLVIKPAKKILKTIAVKNPWSLSNWENLRAVMGERIRTWWIRRELFGALSVECGRMHDF